jgi:hypothetical protein
MKKIAILACIIMLSTITEAQYPSNWNNVFAAINKEVLDNSNAYASLKISSETIGHRLTGSENGKKVEQYVYDLLKSYGCSNVQFQPFEVESWSRGTISLQVGEQINNLQNIKTVSLAHAPVAALEQLPIVDMGNGVEADYQSNPEKVKGKIALVYLGVLPNSPKGTPGLHRSEKAAIAIKYGAKGIIVINTAPKGVLLTGTASVTGKLIPIPAICIGLEDGMKLKEQIQNGKSLIAKIDLTNNSKLIKARNVIVRFKGTTLPNEKIVVGGHLDSWDLATGAMDNGIGSFSVIDMARTFQKLQLKTARTIEFVLFMGEEQGLLGSRAYVDAARKDKSIDQIRYMLNYDMTNNPKGYSTTAAESKPLLEFIGNIAHSLDTGFKNTIRIGAGLHSDHQPFMLQGVPTGGGADGALPNGAGPCYHADCDVFSLVDDMDMRNTIRFNAMLVYGIADATVLEAKHFTDLETKEFLIKNNLKVPLQIAGEWRWD